MLISVLNNVIFRNYKLVGSNLHLFTMCTCGYASYKEGKGMMKVIYGSKRPKKRHWYEESKREKSLHEHSDLNFIGISGGGKTNLRRQNVLNKLFMQHVSDIMTSDETFFGKQIQITKVKVNPDWSLVKLYWYSSSVLPNEHNLPNLLDTYAHTLRNNLSKLRVMGRVPPIQFIPDKEHALNMQVDSLLKIADFGPDESTEDIIPITSENFIHSTKLDINSSLSTDVLPPKRHTVLGLDQSEIMNRIKRISKKHISLHENSSYESSLNDFTNVAATIKEFSERNESSQNASLKKIQKERRMKKNVVVNQDFEDDDELYDYEDGDYLDESDSSTTNKLT